MIKRKTAPDRFRRGLLRIKEWCRKNRHVPVRQQQKDLGAKLRGHYAFYGITGNSDALSNFYEQVKNTWKRWLDRRSQRARMGWGKFAKLLRKYPLPPPRAVHSVLRQVANP